MKRTIRAQLLIPPLVLLLGVGGSTAWTAYSSAGRARDRIETQVRQVARTLIESDFPLKPHVLEQMKGLSGAEFVLQEPDGRRTATLPQAALPDVLPEGVVQDWRALRLTGRTVLGEVSYFLGGVELPPPRRGTLLILYPESLWRDALWEAAWPSLAVGGLLGGLAVTAALGLGQRLSRRIAELERQTRRIAEGDFKPVPVPGHDDELGRLAQSVNEMARQLAALQEGLRETERLRLLGQVGTGLAHQLRNGLAGARLAVQLHALECTAEPDALNVALRQLTLQEENLRRFLDLGQANRPRREPCTLNDLVAEAVALYRPQCRHARIELTWVPPEGPVQVEGDGRQLGHLLHNLLSNAIEAAGPGGRVTVCLQNEPRGRSILEVWDTGPGPPADIAERLFEPFVSGKADGIGLGLTVAGQVARGHGGSLTWRREGGQTCFRAEIPAGDLQ